MWRFMMNKIHVARKSWCWENVSFQRVRFWKSVWSKFNKKSIFFWLATFNPGSAMWDDACQQRIQREQPCNECAITCTLCKGRMREMRMVCTFFMLFNPVLLQHIRCYAAVFKDEWTWKQAFELALEMGNKAVLSTKWRAAPSTWSFSATLQ